MLTKLASHAFDIAEMHTDFGKLPVLSTALLINFSIVGQMIVFFPMIIKTPLKSMQLSQLVFLNEPSKPVNNSRGQTKEKFSGLLCHFFYSAKLLSTSFGVWGKLAWSNLFQSSSTSDFCQLDVSVVVFKSF